MSDGYKKHSMVSPQQLKAIRAALERADLVAERPVSQTPAGEEAHLSDAAFLTLCFDGVEGIDAQSRLHLARCPVCRAERERLQRLGELWQDAQAVERLEQRRDAALHIGAIQPAGMPWRPRIALTALIPAPMAAAAQGIPDLDTLSFPVYENGAPVAGLTATLRRRSREFYALITPQDADAIARYGERSALLTIAAANDPTPLLRREIEIGVAVLLGTDLALTADSYVEADLMPVS